MKRSILTVLAGMWFATFCFSQEEIPLKNPSFEDRPHRGISNSGVHLWYDCGLVRFPGETPPDIHPGGFWDVYVDAQHDSTFLGMVVRETETYEGVAQRLIRPMEAGQCYEFSVYLASSPSYNSPTRQSIGDRSFTTPAVFRMWGGTGVCDERQLLASSDPIDHKDWRQYKFKLEPSQEFRYILLEAYYKTPSPFPYNGNILVDNMSSLIEVDCEEPLAVEPQSEVEEEEPAIAAATPPVDPVDNGLKGPQPTSDTRTTEAKKEPEEPKPAQKEKILKELDIQTVKTGQTILIEKLYFDEDSTQIKDASYAVLDEIYDFMDQNPGIYVEIGGHTNGRPGYAYANELSTKRAESVASYLVNKGISSSRLAAKGYGKSRPIASNRTKDGLAKNQRVEIKILSVDGTRPRF